MTTTGEAESRREQRHGPLPRVATALALLSATLVGADSAVASVPDPRHGEVVLLVGTPPSTDIDPSAPRPGDMVSDGGFTRFSSPPLYLDGGRRIAEVTFGPGQSTASVSFTPRHGTVFVKAFGGCTSDSLPHVHLHLLATLNGVTIDDTQCSQGQASSVAVATSGTGRPGVDNPDSDYSTIGVHPGRTSTLAVAAHVSSASAAAPTGGYAVYERIPFSQMPLPPAPARLRLPPTGRDPVLIDSRTTAATGTWYVTARAGATLELVRAAPGDLTVSYEGRQLGESVGYDWQTGGDTVWLDQLGLDCGCSVPPPKGTLRLTVHASGFTRAGWYVVDHRFPDPVPTVYLQCGSTECQPVWPSAGP